VQQLSDALKKEKEQEQQLLKINQLLNAHLASTNSRINQKYIEARIANYDHLIDMMKVQEAVFEWQHMAGNVILILVVVVVLSGVGFSGLQLYKAVTEGGPQASSELEVSATKFRVTSSVVGIIVLTLSLAFLYLFIMNVYTIRYTETPASHTVGPLPPSP